jgi:2-polyprenyl-6-hydroxyphenyl methylase/3-demethylubiquinone-9 3-methyltransferase
VLGIVPVGTHEWSKFIPPQELAQQLDKNGLTVSPPSGIVINPLTLKWTLHHEDTDVNYILHASKSEAQ